ncbi:GspH/FimT family pseudopilin [Shewanella seohaensis]|uniref:GspH/FimT family pseudopilin n=1 Tax=Shewanella seohaensis TaxID=755175 RepID=UPI0035BAD0DE
MLNKLLGFTLVELMVTIAVAAILLTIGVPSLISVYEGVRVNNNIAKIHDIMVFARNQAVSYGATIKVCASNGSACGTNWGNGIKVISPDNKDIRVIDAFNTNDSVKSNSASFTFSSEGMLSANSAVEIIYCAGGSATNSKSVNISSSGLISYGADGKSCS